MPNPSAETFRPELPNLRYSRLDSPWYDQDKKLEPLYQVFGPSMHLVTEFCVFAQQTFTIHHVHRCLRMGHCRGSGLLLERSP